MSGYHLFGETLLTFEGGLFVSLRAFVAWIHVFYPAVLR